jgi:hypothetical protein
MRRTIVAISIILLIPILMSTTCNNEESYWEIKDVNVLFGSLNSTDFYNKNQSSVFTTDTLIMEVTIIPNYLTSNTKYPNIFIQEAIAYYPSYLDSKLNHSISKLTITSNEEFDGIAAGESINNKLVVLKDAQYQQVTETDWRWYYTNEMSIQDYVYQYLVQGTSSNGLNYQGKNYFVIRFKTKPSKSTHVFTFDFEDSQGTHFRGKSNTLKWE